MKKIIDNKILFILLLIAGLGFLFGLVFIFLIDKMDKLIIKTEITEYISLILNKSYSIKKGVMNEITNNLVNYSLIFISSVIFILLPLVLFFDFYIFFTFGFMISSFIYTYKVKGLMYLIYFIFPFKILNICLILMFIMFSIKFSKKIYLFFSTNEEINIKLYTKKYIIIYLLFIVTSIIISVLEMYLSLFLLTI